MSTPTKQYEWRREDFWQECFLYWLAQWDFEWWCQLDKKNETEQCDCPCHYSPSETIH